MPELLEAGSIDSASEAEVAQPSFVPWRLTHGRLDVRQETELLLRARWEEGDAVRHARFGWSGIVIGRWVEADGTVWVAVECQPDEPTSLIPFHTRADLLLPYRPSNGKQKGHPPEGRVPR
ncbi:MAG TPA: hypothetical protein DEB30_04940 [Candidatus Peribacter riflensis]|nr:MAG: hypothetical protein A2412_00915 [Candidatus Peribacteria bacterium RIFOXYC1_FULL_58_8]HBU10107.1 hypothetical protein [Candidatus Peribacter riflensis]